MVTKLASGWNSDELPGRIFATEQAFIAEAKRKGKKGKEEKKKASDGTEGMAKSLKGEEHPWQACMDKVKRHKIDVDNPEAFCGKAKSEV